VELGATAALIWVHRQCDRPDEQEIVQLQTALSILEDRASPAGFLLAATFHWHTGGKRDARRYLLKVLDEESFGEMTPIQAQIHNMYGWLHVSSFPTSKSEKEQLLECRKYFERVLSSNKQDLEALLGLAKYNEIQMKYRFALDKINEAIVVHPWFVPALFEKAKLLLLMKDWDQCIETAERILSKDQYDIDALRICILFNLTRESRIDTACQYLEDLNQALRQKERNNHQLFFEVSRLFSRVAGRGNPNVIRITINLAEMAKQLAPTSSVYLSEYAHQLSMMKQYSDALRAFKEATKLDNSNSAAFEGMIYCQIMQGSLSDAEAQLEFMSVMQQGTVGNASRLSYLNALLAWRKNGDREKHAQYLDEAVENLRHRQMDRSDIFMTYVNHEPDFMLQIAQEYFLHCGEEPLDLNDPLHSYLDRGLSIVNEITREYPGLASAQILLAKAKYLGNDIDNALQSASLCVSLDPTFSDAHLLMARIGLQREDYRMASQSLEQALSHDFKVRVFEVTILILHKICYSSHHFLQVKKNPVYYYIKAQVLQNSVGKETGEVDKKKRVLEEALAALEKGMAIDGVKSGYDKEGKPQNLVPLYDRASIFIGLAQVLIKLSVYDEDKSIRKREATQIIMSAMQEFRGTAEEIRVIVLNSELSIMNGRFDAAISMLNNIPVESPQYMKAQILKADIFLKHRRDERAYAQCFQRLVEQSPTSQSYMHLGEAYMRIQNPDDAIGAFEEALKLNPRNVGLASKIGKALLSTHDYKKAMNYYQEALRSSENGPIQLRLDLAGLYLKLKNYGRAADVLDEYLSKDGDINDDDDEDGPARNRPKGGRNVVELTSQVKCLLLLAKIHDERDDQEKVLTALATARSTQKVILSEVRSDQTEMQRQQRHVSSEVSHKLGLHFEKVKDLDKAQQHYADALKSDDSNEKVMLSLAKLSLKKGDVNTCQRHCMTLMRIDQNNDEASLMISDLMFQKNDFETAVYHYRQFLERKPNHYVALARLINVLRRSGKLEAAEPYIKTAERTSPRSAFQAGFNFCQGLFHRYSNRLHEAVTFFNKARRDHEWGNEALYHMIQIYLNPNNENIWDDPEGDLDNGGESLKVAEELLRELPVDNVPLKLQVLECQVLLYSRNRGNVDRLAPHSQLTS
jgi:tetratricopeptide repeat protein 21B